MTMPVLACVALVARHSDTLGALQHVEQTISDFIDYSKCWTMARAVSCRYMRLLRRILVHRGKDDNKGDNKGSCMDIERAMEVASASGDMEMVQFRHETFPQHSKTRCLELAASNGHLDVLRWIYKHRNEKDTLSMSAFDFAAGNGHLDVVEWMHANRSRGCSTRAMDCAARNGHLHIVQWLHAHRQEGCTTQAIDWAAQEGHFEVVQWLLLNRQEGCSSIAIDAAASNGHLKLVHWLHEHCNVTCSYFACAMAAERGHHHILEYIGQIEQT